mmetsp:Transcript_21122/g.46988  ORF Transcript_21122/g.46988 Transcript_21122/m.46988 type:complete len:392 (+) Transcript_21122:1085-2260(+)
MERGEVLQGAPGPLRHQLQHRGQPRDGAGRGAGRDAVRAGDVRRAGHAWRHRHLQLHHGCRGRHHTGLAGLLQGAGRAVQRGVQLHGVDQDLLQRREDGAHRGPQRAPRGRRLHLPQGEPQVGQGDLPAPAPLRHARPDGHLRQGYRGPAEGRRQDDRGVPERPLPGPDRQDAELLRGGVRRRRQDHRPLEALRAGQLRRGAQGVPRERGRRDDLRREARVQRPPRLVPRRHERARPEVRQRLLPGGRQLHRGARLPADQRRPRPGGLPLHHGADRRRARARLFGRRHPQERQRPDGHQGAQAHAPAVRAADALHRVGWPRRGEGPAKPADRGRYRPGRAVHRHRLPLRHEPEQPREVRAPGLLRRQGVARHPQGRHRHRLDAVRRRPHRG